ncbi:MAG: tetratricopeptide repeat protein [Chloroflexota bacterium]
MYPSIRRRAITIKTSFGQWLKQHRKALDLTQEALAQRIGCAAITLYKIEANERRTSRQMAELLADHFNIPADERPAFIRFARTETVEESVPWDTLFHSPTNLLVQPTVLIGRDEEVSVLHKRLLRSESRLLTLTGAPGIGKTRLGLAVALQALDDFPDGVFVVILAPISDAKLVLTTIATTLGVPDVGPQTPLQRLKAFLRDKEMLLLLDNFEQILAAAAQIAELLTACPWLKLLITSRAPLRIRQERQIPVLPLALPNLASLPDVETVTGYSAVTLFLERAQAVKPDFSLRQDNAATVAAICTRLDGLPLAIELISARVKLLPPSALLERLSGRLLLQSDGLRDIEPRHRTLNAAIEWSYQLLSIEEQGLFRRLGLFVGGWTLEAAEAVCLDKLSLNLLDGLASLLDKNLLKQEAGLDGEPRFRMLETIREYALERLASDDEFDDLRSRHAEYFTTLAERIEPNHLRWLNNLEVEHDNFRAALAWSENGLRRALALGLFWQQRSHLTEGSAWLAGALMQQDVGALTAADRTLRAKALNRLGTFRAWQGDFDSAQPSHEESMTLFRDLKDRVGLAEALGNYAMLFVMRGDHEQAAPPLEESLVLSRDLRNTDLIAQCLLFSGILAYSQGRIDQADVFWEESLALRRTEGNPWLLAILLAYQAMATLDQGDDTRAHGQLTESLILLRDLGERWQTTHTLEVFACLAALQGHLTKATRIFGAAEVLRETLGAPMLLFQRHFNERGVASLRAQLDEAGFAAAWAEGQAMTLDQVVAYALEDTHRIE